MTPRSSLMTHMRGVIACIYSSHACSHTLIHTFVWYLPPSCSRLTGPHLLSPNTQYLEGLCLDVRRNVLEITTDMVLRVIIYVWGTAIHTKCYVVPVKVTGLSGLHNPPRSWTGTWAPPLSGGTIAPCVYSLLCYGSIRWPKSLKIVPKFKVHICILHIYILVVLLLVRLAEPLAHSLELWFLHMCVSIIFP
jgi:hypothetical protein